MGTLLRNYVEVRELIKVSFEVVSGVSPVTDVLDGVVLQGEGRFQGLFLPPKCPTGFNNVFSHRIQRAV